MSYRLEYFEQLTSEKVKTKFKNGRPVRYWELPAGVRNETLDLRAYALAPLYSRSVPWEILARSAPSEPPPAPDSQPWTALLYPASTGGRMVRRTAGRQ